MYLTSIGTSAHTERLRNEEQDVVERLLQASGPVPQVDLRYESDIKTLWLTIRPEPKPIFTLQLLDSVGKVQRAIHTVWGADYARSPVRFLAFRGQGPIFTLGGDLDFYLDCLARNDRPALAEYARLSIEGACLNASSIRGHCITLATIHAKAIGGGIDAPRSCNVMIAEERASFVYPEVKFNHFPITAVAILSRRMGPIEAERLLMTGEELSASEFHRRGALEAVVPNGTGEDWLRRYAAETLPIHAARLALFSAFHRRAGSLEDELKDMADLWTECMLRLSPAGISKLQRIAQAQERLLARTFRAHDVH